MARNRHIKRLKRTASYYLIRAIISFFRILPRRTALKIGALLGQTAAILAIRERRLALTHLTVAFGREKPPAEIRRITRDMFRIMALNFVDTVRVGDMIPEELEEICIPHHMERLHRALAGGRGVIGLTSHTGCWELLGAYLVAVGVPLSVIARRLYDHRLERLLIESREKSGIENITRGHDTRDVLRALKQGRLIGILIDQDYVNVKGMFVDFFGKPASTAVGPAVLSMKYGVPIVPVLTYRDERHRHHVCIGEPVSIKPSGDSEADREALTTACSQAIEAFIREHPEQWVWFHERWRTTPESADSSGLPVMVMEDKS
ncbi:lysophospholipid acyltransferase family protein [Candidatus Latescibacterota bacterium]